MLGLQAQIGTRGVGKPLPADVQRYEPGMDIPDDGHVRYDAEAASLAVMSDRTESITLMGGSLDGRNFRVKNASDFMSLAVIARDGKPLPESNDLLVIRLTNILNTNARFDSDDKVVSWARCRCSSSGALQRWSCRPPLRGASWRSPQTAPSSARSKPNSRTATSALSRTPAVSPVASSPIT